MPYKVASFALDEFFVSVQILEVLFLNNERRILIIPSVKQKHTEPQLREVQNETDTRLKRPLLVNI